MDCLGRPAGAHLGIRLELVSSAATQGINRAVDDTDALVKTLRSVDDAEAIGAAYTLGNIGAIEPLLER